MTITIGTTSDDSLKLTKSFSGNDVTVQLKSPCDILNPVFVLAYNTSYLTANYLYCSDFNRYYFINNVQVLTGNRIELPCSVDVLMSYNNQIKRLICNVKRNQDSKIRSIYMSDSAKPLEAKTITETHVFDADPFVRGDGYRNYVLTVLGGVF